jgi:hypothetical protein
MKWRKVGGSAGRAPVDPGVAVSVSISVMSEIYIGVSAG